MSGLLADLRTLDHAELLVVVFTSLGGIALSVAFFFS